jgi:hypothetical protein
MIIPLKHLKIDGVIDCGHATINMMMEYTNTGTDNPIECTFEFPIEKETVVTKLIAEIDNKVVEAKIKAKEEAKEEYDDAIASGKAAVYASREQKNTETDESITLLLGNLLPGQSATVNI